MHAVSGTPDLQSAPSFAEKATGKVVFRRLGSGSVEPYFQFIIDCVIRISGN
jgi:hypothetical protein